MAKVNSAIGIEYNSHEIKAVELSKGSDGSYKVTAFSKESIAENIMGNYLIISNVERHFPTAAHMDGNIAIQSL